MAWIPFVNAPIGSLSNELSELVASGSKAKLPQLLVDHLLLLVCFFNGPLLIDGRARGRNR